MESNDVAGDPYENSNTVYVGECEASGIIESRKRKASDVLEDRKRKAFNNETMLLDKSTHGEGLRLDTLGDTENLHLEASSERENLQLEASSERENLHLEPSNENQNSHLEASSEGIGLHLEASSAGESLHLEDSNEEASLHLEAWSDTVNLQLEASSEGENLHLEASNDTENMQLEASSDTENLHLEASNDTENKHSEALSEGENLSLEASNDTENLHLDASSDSENLHLDASSDTENMHSEALSEGENLSLEASSDTENFKVEASSDIENLQLEASSDTENLQLDASSDTENFKLEASSDTENLQLEASNEKENLHLDAASEDERQPCTVETVTAQWWSYRVMTICGFIWPRNSGHTAGDEISRGSKPVGIQLTSVSSEGSCTFIVDAKLLSSDVTWEVKAFERKRESGLLQLFKRSAVVEKRRYVDLFRNSTTIQAEKSNVRIRPTTAATTHGLTITSNRTTYREASIEWTCDAPEVDRWLVIIRNEGRTPRQSTDPVEDSEWMILLKPSLNRIDKNLVSLEYKAGHRYTVAVFGLCEEQTLNEIGRYIIVAKSRTSFRAEHTKEDLEKLLTKARGIREHKRTSFRSRYTFAGTSYSSNDHMRCQWLYRDKPKEYFRELKMKQNNIMTVYDKDANGDPASVIHGQLKGLFFSANVHLKTGNPMNPIFGGVRVKIPALKMLSENWKIYFADLYCLNKIHLVTLVLAEPDSEADKFCAEKLICLSRTDKSNNPFLFVSGGSVYVSSRITVEVFYTKNIDLKLLKSEYNGIEEEFDWWKNMRHGGKWKKKDCFTCNLYTSPLQAAFLV